MKKVLVDESLLEAAATAVEQANIYLEALRAIANKNVLTEEGKQLVEVAVNALKNAEDTGVLSQTEFSNEKST